MGFSGGGPARTQKRGRRTRALTISRGGPNQGARSKGPLRGPLGAPKRPGGHWENGFWKVPTSKCMLFLRKYNVFEETPKRSRGGSWATFSRKFGAPGGPGPPPGDFGRFPGGSPAPFGPPHRIPGGPRGGPGAPLFLAGARFVIPGGPGHVKKQLEFIAKSR